MLQGDFRHEIFESKHKILTPTRHQRSDKIANNERTERLGGSNSESVGKRKIKEGKEGKKKKKNPSPATKIGKCLSVNEQ